MGGLEQPRLRLAGIREGPALEAEELRFQQRAGDRRAIDVDEGSAGSRPAAVDRVGKQALSGPRLSEDEDRGLTAGALALPCQEALDLPPELCNGRALAEQLWRGASRDHPSGLRHRRKVTNSATSGEVRTLEHG